MWVAQGAEPQARQHEEVCSLCLQTGLHFWYSLLSGFGFGLRSTLCGLGDNFMGG